MRALLLLLLATSAASAQTGTVAGRVLEAGGVTAVIGANVRIDGTTLSTMTDLDGQYRIIGVPVGTYRVRALYYGAPTVWASDVQVDEGSTAAVSFVLTLPLEVVSDWGVYELPFFTNDAVGQSLILTGSELENMPINR